MLYYITDEIITAAENNNSKVIEVLEGVAMAHRHGKHFVISSRSILQRLSILPYYENKKTAQIYKSILDKYSTCGSIIRRITLKVVFLLDENAYVKIDNAGRYEEIGYPIVSATINNILNETALLGENINEVVFYHYLGEFYKTRNFIQINSAYIPLHGGGDTTKDVLATEAQYKARFCLAFLDSDKKCPTGALGSTLKGVINSRKKNECHYTSDYIYSEKYREVENMIPIKTLRDISEGNIDWMRGVGDIETIQTEGGDFHYYDIKYGINEEKFSKIKDINERIYITQHILWTRKISSEELQNIEKPAKDKILLFGVGGSVLERVVSYYNTKFYQCIQVTSMPDCLEQEWSRMGKEVVNWTCSSYPIRL